MRPPPPSLTCCCPEVSCSDASMRLCPPWLKPLHRGSAVRGPRRVFPHEWTAVPALIHTFYLIYTQPAQASVHNTYSCGKLRPLVVGNTAASINPAEDVPVPGKTHLDLIWGKICLLREKEEVSTRRSDCSLASATWFNLASDSVSDHLYSSYFGKWVRVKAKEGEMEEGEEMEVFVYWGKKKTLKALKVSYYKHFDSRWIQWGNLERQIH